MAKKNISPFSLSKKSPNNRIVKIRKQIRSANSKSCRPNGSNFADFYCEKFLQLFCGL